MVSPFTGFENATLALKMPGENVIEINGNWEAETITTVYTAQLKPSRANTRNYPGIDGASIFLSGYLVDPQWFPDSVKLPLNVDCVIEMQNGGTQSGVLEIVTSPSTGFGVEDITGQKIEGYLIIKDGK